MAISIIIFFIAILATLYIIVRSAWQVQTGKRNMDGTFTPDISFRRIEKYVLYYTKNVVQVTVITIVKYSLIGAIKTKKVIQEKWPNFPAKVRKFFSKKERVNNKPSFIQKALLESKTKIRRIKDKIKKEHAEENTVESLKE